MLVVDFTPRGGTHQCVGCRQLPGHALACTAFSSKVSSALHVKLEKRAELNDDEVQPVSAKVFGVGAIAPVAV